MRSSSVKLALVSTMSSTLLLFGCGSNNNEEEWSRACIDPNQEVVDDVRCDQQQQHPNGAVAFYRWYYMTGGGSRPVYYPVGSRASGGTFETPRAFTSGIHAPGRGGFGPTGEAHSAGRGGFGSTSSSHSTSS